MATRIYDKCPCCDSKMIASVLSCEDFTVSHNTFEVWECSTCTFRFTQNVPDAAAIAPYYKSAAYVSHSDTRQGLVNRLYHLVRNITLRGKRDLVTKLTGLKKGFLLDIGAGTGAFAHTMKLAGWKVTGLEPDDTARTNALKNYNLELQESDTFYQLNDTFFDAVTMWHVLEHVHDLRGYLQALRKILKPSGKLFIAVPNYTSYDAKFYRQYWAAYDVPRHLYHFSPKSMKVLLEKNGFVLETIRPMWYDSFYVSMLSEQYRRGSGHFVKAIGVGLVSNLKTMSNVGNCSSIIYIVRRS